MIWNPGEIVQQGRCRSLNHSYYFSSIWGTEKTDPGENGRKAPANLPFPPWVGNWRSLLAVSVTTALQIYDVDANCT